MDAFEQYFSSSLLQSIQTFVVAIIVLLIEWLIAKIIANGIEKGLGKTGITEKFFSKFSTSKSKPDIYSSKIITKVIYYILKVIVFIIFFNLLNLQIIEGPLIDLISNLFNLQIIAVTLEDLISTFFDFIPAVMKEALILLVAFMFEYISQWAIVNIGKKTGLGKLFVKLKVADTIEKAEEYVSTVAKVV